VILTAVTAVLAVLSAALVAPSPAAAAPVRNDSKNEAIVFVHGINLNLNTDCTADWGRAGAVLRREGFTGQFVTYGYYRNNRRCTHNYNGTTDTSLNTVARNLATYIYDEFSRHGKPVDIVAHSMGGLIAHRAISGTQRGDSGFPSYLYVEDVVTLSTPHGGANSAHLCTTRLQCDQMQPGSDFIRSLRSNAPNPQSRFGTDWSTIGSWADEAVSWDSSMDMRAGHKYAYRPSARLGHTGIREHDSTARTFDLQWWHAEGPRNGVDLNAPVALSVAAQCLYRRRPWYVTTRR